MSSKLENQNEKVSEILPEEVKPQDVDNIHPENESTTIKLKHSAKLIDSLINRNIDAKKMLADELCEMGLSVDEILRILRF